MGIISPLVRPHGGYCAMEDRVSAGGWRPCSFRIRRPPDPDHLLFRTLLVLFPCRSPEGGSDERAHRKQEPEEGTAEAHDPRAAPGPGSGGREGAARAAPR